MWAEVEHYISAVGPYGAFIALMVPVITVLGVCVLIRQIGKSQIPEGEIKFGASGVKVRWGKLQKEPEEEPEKHVVSSNSKRIRRGSEKDHSLPAVDPDM